VSHFPSFRRTPESRGLVCRDDDRTTWTPAFAGVTLRKGVNDSWHNSNQAIRLARLVIPAQAESRRAAQRASLAELDALFASLQHRAFRGEL
jgi:hypothetical protein